jgi:hypothetical protein
MLSRPGSTTLGRLAYVEVGVNQRIMTWFGLAALAFGSGAAISACGGPTHVNALRPAVSARSVAANCPACEADPTRYLRQLSLDLRGRPPSLGELDQVQRDGVVRVDLIDAMLKSDEFLAQARAWHRALLWPTLEGFRIHATSLVASDTNAKTGRREGNVFSPDPALLETTPSNAPPVAAPGSTAPPHQHAVVSLADNGIERGLRGMTGIVGCDGNIEYPPAKARSPQPSYIAIGSDKKKRSYPYYDRDGVPLPVHDALHCPNYCSNKTDTERAAPGYKAERALYSPMSAQGADAQPHELDPPGMHCPETHPYRVINACTNAILPQDGENQVRERREGYRMMKHYWSGATPVRTCAYEAQERTVSAYTGASCASQVLRDSSCGCGPEGAYCMPAVANNGGLASRAEFRVRSALNDEPLRIVSSVIERDEDYFDIFTTRRSFVTGALAYLYRKQLPALSGLEIASPAPPEALPDVAYDDAGWHEFVREAEHAGVLTTAAYLGRFPTWRARVSQFRSAFMCRPFTPAAASLPSPDDPCTREPNLAKRCGCKNCHTAIEPMTAYFGRWAERSVKYLSPTDYPAFDPNCAQCALTGQGCTPRCRTNYVVDTVDADGARYAGTLRGYLYRTPEEEARIDEGPAGLVASAVASGELSACTVRTTWTKLLGRPMSEHEMSEVLPELVTAFDAHHHIYRDLVRAIVTSPAYRRVD